MTQAELYNLQQLSIKYLREQLNATPLIIGNIQIAYIYRKHEAKPTQSNYIDLAFSTYNTNRGLACRSDDIYLDFDVYSTNEILTQKIAFYFNDFMENMYIDESHVIVNPQLNGGVVELSKNAYVQRVTAKIVT